MVPDETVLFHLSDVHLPDLPDVTVLLLGVPLPGLPKGLFFLVFHFLTYPM